MMLPAFTATANLNHLRTRVELSSHASSPSLNLPVLASHAEFSLQVVAGPAGTTSHSAAGPLFPGRQPQAPYQGRVPSIGASPASGRRFCPRLSRVSGAHIAGSAQVERGGQARKPIDGGWKFCASAQRSQCPSLNSPLHGTGRSGLHVFNHRARPARERERWASRENRAWS